MASDEQGTTYPHRPRVKHTRSATGCLTCRRRRKKCDESVPICLACSRNQLMCEWPDTVEKAERSGMLDPAVELHYRLPNVHSFHLPDPFQSAVVKKTSKSGALLRQYIVHTSVLLSARSDVHDQFRILVLQMAHYDELLAHTVVTLGGEHINWDESASIEVRQATILHKSHALRGIQDGINAATNSSRISRYRLALILLLLCFAEAMRAAPNADMYIHLRAVRQLIATDWHTTTLDKHCHLTGLVLESYAYLALVSNIVPIDPGKQRMIPLDPFITNVAYLYQFDTFGCHLYLGYDVYEAIPLVCLLAHERVAAGDNEEDLARVREKYNLLRNLVLAMQRKNGLSFVDSHNEAARLAREIFCKGLLIFLEATADGPATAQPTDTTRQYLAEYFEHIPKIRDSKYGTSMLWPTLMFGSCIVDKDEQRHMGEALVVIPQWELNIVLLVYRVLQLIWADPDPHCFGPYGLTSILKKHNLVLPMA